MDKDQFNIGDAIEVWIGPTNYEAEIIELHETHAIVRLGKSEDYPAIDYSDIYHI